MKIVGKDTIAFLKSEKLISEYIEVLDFDFSSIDVNDNYVVLTKVITEDDPEFDVLCLCFYFAEIPSDTTESKIASILSDHADLLADISIFMHFSAWSKDELDSLGSNPSREARTKLFEDVIS